MKRTLAKFLLSLSSFSGVVFFYVVSNQDVPFVSAPWGGLVGEDMNLILKNIAYVAGFLGLSYISLLVTPKVFKGGESMTVTELKPIESVAIPTYIGMFVIAIGIDSSLSGGIILLALFLFWLRIEKIFYFNPVWLIFGYRFYEVKTIKDNTFTFITKRDRLKGGHEFKKLYRINNYTFFERSMK